MKLTYRFSSLADWSSVESGEGLLQILHSHGLLIDKADDAEPIRKVFDPSSLSDFWRGVGPEGGHATCYFLFRGQKESRFSGMVTWNKNLSPRSKAFNGLSLWLTPPKGWNADKLVHLGDELFIWSKAVYGFISEDSKDQSQRRPGWISEWLPGVMWVNYFGESYVTASEFHVPQESVSVGQGTRLRVTHSPEDPRLADTNFVQQIKRQIGAEWFGEGPRSKYRVPLFDRSGIVRPQV